MPSPVSGRGAWSMTASVFVTTFAQPLPFDQGEALSCGDNICVLIYQMQVILK